jgi:hemerythrin-like metal-binding protein
MPFSSLDALPPASQNGGVHPQPLGPGRQAQGLQQKFRAMLTGIPDIDFEHEQLMLQLERIYHSNRLEAARADIDKFIRAWHLHHLHEELHMKSTHYPDFAAHAEQHARLLDRYRFVRNEAMHSEVDQESIKAYVEIVAKMLADHVASVDMLYVRWGNA